MRLGGCAIMPDIAPDWALPMRRSYFTPHASFNLRSARSIVRYLMSCSTRETGRLGHAQSQIGSGHRSWSWLDPEGTRYRDHTILNWVLGTGNGVTLDMKGNRTGSIDFIFVSEKLILIAPCRASVTLSPIMPSRKIWASRIGFIVRSRPQRRRARRSTIRSLLRKWSSSSTARPPTLIRFRRERTLRAWVDTICSTSN